MGFEGQPGASALISSPHPIPRPSCKAGSPCSPWGWAVCQPSHPIATNRKACLLAQISETKS